LGARATITLTHPQAARITAAARSEIDRLEDIFSLYRPGSELSRLNASGALAAPSPDLLACLTLAGAVHAASAGLFDPTIQRLWAAHAAAAAAGRALDQGARQAALAQTGWHRVRVGADAIALDSGMALTLNGIAQGFVADRVAEMLATEGLTDILIDTGEFHALGGNPAGGAWPVGLAQGGEVALRARALATSAPLGTTFDQGGTLGHILDPRTGVPAAPRWRGVTISAPAAALADALSTTACLLPDAAAISALCGQFRDARVESTVAA
jgi:thiamine biosynthesis lipoprotein